MTAAEAARIFEGHIGHEGDSADPGGCLICRRQLEVFLRWGETLPDPQAPDPSWFEDAEGWVRAPLSYENREGDPNLNGAFDKW